MFVVKIKGLESAHNFAEDLGLFCPCKEKLVTIYFNVTSQTGKILPHVKAISQYPSSNHQQVGLLLCSLCSRSSLNLFFCDEIAFGPAGRCDWCGS